MANTNHLKPDNISNYATFITELHARIDDVMKMCHSINVTGSTNVPVGAVRWDNTLKTWRSNTGSNWTSDADLSTYYNININGTVGATTASTGAFTTISTSGVASLGANSTVGGSIIVTASNSVTLTSKTLTSPIISTIINGAATLTLPTSTDTLVGLNTADTLTQKTLTNPKFGASTGLKDASGNSLIQFPALVTTAINYLLVSNAATGGIPTITASGGDANVSLKLASSGTGIVYINAVQAADISTTQTFSNKTLTLPVITSISNAGTVTIPAGTDTLVNLAGTQSLANKTISASAFNGTLGATTAAAATVTTLQVNTSLNVSGTATATTFSGAGTSLTGTAASLTAGAANSVAWTNVSGRPTLVSSFTNDAGYLISSGTIANATNASSASTSSQVSINYNNDSASTYQMLWGSGNSVYGTAGIYCNPSTDVIYSTGINVGATGVYTTGNVSAASDETIKTNWRDLLGNFVELLASVKYGIYDRIDCEMTQVGVSAQALQKILPEAVTKSDSGLLSVAYGNAALVACIELAKEVISLKEEIKVLHASIIR